MSLRSFSQNSAAGLLLLTGCAMAPRKPLMVLPSATEVKVASLEKENLYLREQMSRLVEACTKLVTYYREEAQKSALPQKSTQQPKEKKR